VNTTVDLLRAHQVVAELIVAHDLRVQHLDYHPAIRSGMDPTGPPLQLTTVTVAVPSQPVGLVGWCAALGITDVEVQLQVGVHNLVARGERHGLLFRVTTSLCGDDRDQLHGRVRWDRDERTGRRRRTGTTSVHDVVAALCRIPSAPSGTSTPAAAGA
jgi:hypothetical protein